jgi:hypothetical protein
MICSCKLEKKKLSKDEVKQLLADGFPKNYLENGTTLNVCRKHSLVFSPSQAKQ